jgi:aspartate/methionine/tyrosine aminotransferase
MRAMQSAYMHWAKFKSPVRFELTGSEVPHVHMDRFPISIADLELDGASYPRYAALRKAIAHRYSVTAEQVVTADGTSMANFLAMATLIAPGDEVLIERPAYEPLLAAASFLGASIKRFDRSKVFGLEPEAVGAAIGKDTRLIVITNLHNPSGVLASQAELRAIGTIAERVGARVLVDEVYLDAAVPRELSAAHLGPHFISTNSLTKVYGLSGLRCGWVIAEPQLAERIWRVNDLFGVNQAHPAERLACIAFEKIEQLAGETKVLLEHNRRCWNAFLTSRRDLDCSPAKHNMTAFPRWIGGDTQKLDDLLREKYDAAVVPGTWFEMPDHFRIGLALPTSEFEAGLSRLGSALDELA